MPIAVKVFKSRIVSYILMQLSPGKAKAAAEAISKIEGVKMAHAVTGPFDVIAFAQVSDLSALSDLLLAQIQRVDGVEKTQTAVVVSPDALSDLPKKRAQHTRRAKKAGYKSR